MTWPANSLNMEEFEIEAKTPDNHKGKAVAAARNEIVRAVQVLGDNLLSLIKAYSYRNIPLHLVKHIAKQVFIPIAAFL